MSNRERKRNHQICIDKETSFLLLCLPAHPDSLPQALVSPFQTIPYQKEL